MISFKPKLNRSSTPELTPLLDVIFILLIFFVISAVFTTKGMDIELPPAESSRPVTGRTIEIELRSNGDVLYETIPTTLWDLSHKLRLLAEKPAASQPEHIIFKSSPDANVKNFIHVVDMIREKGFSNLVIATSNKHPHPTAKERR
ncbi:MAG: biopolymer transporter ExbD [Desulfovibrionales bacterium]|nr:biopolymer transporter ExbD [Desulfovibrionales bacterium]